MGRGYAFQQQQSAYASRKESQQQSYAVHKEGRYTTSDCHKIRNHISEMPIVPSVCLDSEVMRHKALFDGSFAMVRGDCWHSQNMTQNGWSHGFDGGKTLMPFGANEFDFNCGSSSQFLNHYSAVFNNAMGNSEFENVKEALGLAGRTMRMQEMRYESSCWGGDDHGHNYNRSDNGVNWKRNGYSRFEWTSKGI